MKTIKMFMTLILVVVSLLSLNQPGLSRDTRGQEPQSFKAYLPLITVMGEAIPCSTPPTLLAPENGTTITTLRPTFRWDNGDDPALTHVNLEVALNPEFEGWRENMSGSGFLGQQEWELPRNFDEGQTYYWRVQLTCGDTKSPFSQTWSFTTPDEVEKLPGPELISPPDGSEHDTFPILFEWKAVPGAVGYQLNIRKEYMTSHIYVSEAQYLLLGSSWTGEWVEWSVGAISPTGIGELSEWWIVKLPP